MVFEQFIESKQLQRHKFYLFFLGFFYTFIAYYVARLFFGSYDISIAILFTMTLLLVPSLHSILNTEEKKDSKGLSHFLKEHKDIFEVYIFISIGVFIGYLCIGSFINFDNTFAFQIDYLTNYGGVSDVLVNNFVGSAYDPGLRDVAALISQNILVVAIAFILSIFYGSGAVFLAVLNASVFAAFMVRILGGLVASVGDSLIILVLYLAHLVPEISGVILAAIAGGIASRAIVREKFMSKKFSNVMKNTTLLLLASVLLIIIAAFMETFVTAKLVNVLF